MTNNDKIKRENESFGSGLDQFCSTAYEQFFGRMGGSGSLFSRNKQFKTVSTNKTDLA